MDLDRLRLEGFSETVISAVDSVTRRDGEGYEEFVPRASQDIGRAVKRADLIDNLDLSRIVSPSERDHERVAKYRRALALLP